MDPKMDINVGKPKVIKLEDRRHELEIDLTEKQIISIMDELLCALFSWFEGYMLPQCVQTCLYLQDLSLIKDKYLLSFVKVYLTVLEEIRFSVSNGEVREVRKKLN
jgi:hypothetical protein